MGDRFIGSVVSVELSVSIKMANQEKNEHSKKRKKRNKEKKKKNRSKSCSDCDVTPSVPSLRPQESVEIKKLKSKNVKLPKILDHKQRAASFSEYTLRRPLNAAQQRKLAKTGSAVEKRGKNGSKVPLLVAIKPENQCKEKEKFMRSSYHVSPQFIYKYPINSATMERMGQPSQFLLPLAIKIMRHAIHKHGSYEKFEESAGGRTLTRTQIHECVKKYLAQEGIENEVQVKVCEDLLSRGCMTRMRGQPTVQVRAQNIRENWIEGLLRHELGTHYLRSCNNKQQMWSNWKKRAELELRPFNPTEEGLASIHSVIFRPHPVLWKNALLYFATCKAFEMSFSQLFKEMGQFVRDPDIRWEYCLRAKRGQTDTSLPGAFCKDQVYLKGALEILKYRHKIDFHLLMRSGKVSYRDLGKLKGSVELENTRIPSFMENISDYKEGLDQIMIANGLTDDDLAFL